MNPLRFAVIGTGFWSNYQIAAWKELEEVELVAVYNRTPEKAEAVAKKFGVPKTYTAIKELLNNETLDFVDIISNVDTHLAFTLSAATRGLDVICQKPMATSLTEAEKMVNTCKKHSVKLFI